MENNLNLVIRTYSEQDLEPVLHLWQQCNLVVPQNDPEADIWLKTERQPELFFIGTTIDKVITTLMAGYDGHRGWINYLAVHPAYQRQGIGKQMVFYTMEKLKVLGCPKVNLQIRKTNTGVMQFYAKIGFKTDDVISMGYRF